MDGVPGIRGERLGIVLGSGLPVSPLGGGERRTLTLDGRNGRSIVQIADHGSFVVIHRHGPDGRIPAHQVDHHANVRALAEAGCDRVLALGSCGSLRFTLGPGELLAVDDFLALGSYGTFHDTVDGYGVRGVSEPWRAQVRAAWTRSGRPVADGGTYAQSTGPRFETRAEIRWMAAYADVVGMTLASECFLAAEAGLRYAAICQVDNYANGIAAPAGSSGSAADRDAAEAYVVNSQQLQHRLGEELIAAVSVIVGSR
jgi:5'-methylthioadenosine phosphorylase